MTSLFARVTAIAAGLTLACTGALAQTARHAITHEDLWLMKRVGAPVPSPDGKWIVVCVTEPAYDEKDQVADLWIVPGDGSAEPRRLTSNKAKENGVTWSDDSKRIAFSTKRDGDDVEQIYVLDVAAGGEAERVTNLSTAARSPQFSPDGSRLLFVSTVYRGALTDADNKRIAEEHKARKYDARTFDGFPIRNWDQWVDPDRQPHVFVQALQPAAAAKDLLAGSKLAASPGFAGRRTDSGEELDAVWTPDGRGIVFTASTDRNAAAYAFTHSVLLQVDAEGGEPRQLTPATGSWSDPQFSPDGKTLYGIFEQDNGTIYSLSRVASLSWPQGGAITIVSRSLDRSVSSFGVTPDGGQIYALAEDAGHEKLYALPAAGGSHRLAYPLESGAYSNLGIAAKADGARLYADWESATSPAEIVRLDPEAGQHAALSHFNTAHAAQIDWQPVREFTFTSRRGRHIHNMVVLPPAFDASRKYPLFVVIHGGPHSMWRDQFVLRWNYHLLAAPGYVVLLTNYTGSTGFGEKFAQAIQGDPLKTPADELNQAADEAVKRFAFIDASRQCAGGASYGGHLANWLQASTTRYRCLISHAGLINLESQYGTSDTVYGREVMNGGPPWEQGAVWRQQNPIRYAERFKTPVLVTVGEHDFRVPMNNAIEYWTALQRQKVASRLIVFPDENHWILKGEDSRYFYQEVQAWLARWLGEG
ncbi:MAG TPA: S9 family peptidase [Steroidobacteraceae bacterium]|nr:S9 family peptidase [Steroidobacteraceae bacterium]